ncbi:MAG TPA: hypothetical protein VJS68_00115 [Thermoplasmata archaeon]|nr:hypothetical protein [Thermoplasmata archaeon]
MPALRRPRTRSEESPVPLEEIVPERLVLTELARGFLLAQGTDAHQATRFARRFLKEKSALPPRESVAVPVESFPPMRPPPFRWPER